MGWPLAVSHGLLARRDGAVASALGYLGAGHALAVLAITLPFGLLASLLAWQRPMQIVASLLPIGFGIWLLLRRRHARALARIRPTQFALWSFAIAIAHGAGLMLIPIYLGLCGPDTDAGHQAVAALSTRNLAMALAVALVHTVAMVAAGGVMAWLTYRHVGLQCVRRSWFNLDAIWAGSLIVVGLVSLAMLA
ncbi:hypothetical protein [Cupriavidus agavae]|nr:hypothetical protein [Cupriavidus agavae]